MLGRIGERIIRLWFSKKEPSRYIWKHLPVGLNCLSDLILCELNCYGGNRASIFVKKWLKWYSTRQETWNNHRMPRSNGSKFIHVRLTHSEHDITCSNPLLHVCLKDLLVKISRWCLPFFDKISIVLTTAIFSINYGGDIPIWVKSRIYT